MILRLTMELTYIVYKNVLESSLKNIQSSIVDYFISIVQMSLQSWTWRTWTGRQCVLLGLWIPTPSLWPLSQPSPPTSLTRGLIFVHALRQHAREIHSNMHVSTHRVKTHNLP